MCVNEVCMHVFKCVCYIKCICNVCLGNYNMYVGAHYVFWVYMCARVCMHVCKRMYVVYVCVRVYIRVSSWVGLCIVAFRTRLVRSGPVARDPDPIRIRARWGPNTLAIENRPMG